MALELSNPVPRRSVRFTLLKKSQMGAVRCPSTEKKPPLQHERRRGGIRSENSCAVCRLDV